MARVDYETMQRTLKQSAHWFGEVVQKIPSQPEHDRVNSF